MVQHGKTLIVLTAQRSLFSELAVHLQSTRVPMCCSSSARPASTSSDENPQKQVSIGQAFSYVKFVVLIFPSAISQPRDLPSLNHHDPDWCKKTENSRNADFRILMQLWVLLGYQDSRELPWEDKRRRQQDWYQYDKNRWKSS